MGSAAFVNQTRQIRETVRNVRFALRLVLSAGRFLAALHVALTVAMGVMPFALLYGVKLVIDGVAHGVPGGGATNVAAAEALLPVLGGLACLAVVFVCLRSATKFVKQLQSEVVSDSVKDALQAQAVRVDLAYYDDAEYYDSLHRAQLEGPTRPSKIAGSMAELGQRVTSLAVVGAMLVALDYRLAVVLLLSALPNAWVQMKFSRLTYTWAREATPDQRRAWYMNRLLTRADFAKEVRLFGLGPMLRRRFRATRTALRTGRLALLRRRVVAESLAQSLPAVCAYGVLAYLAYRVIDGAATVGDLVLIHQSFSHARQSLGEVFDRLAHLHEDSLHMASLMDFLALEPTVRASGSPLPVPCPMRTGISFEHVSYRYPGAEENALSDISLEVRAGETVALVGSNGSGKSTLIKLLARLYDPDTGVIRIDDVDVRDIDLEELRGSVSAVFQDFARYQMTVAENILLRESDGPNSVEEAARAARHAGSHARIRALPIGYDTLLGRLFDDGVELSAGEWQRIAIARALARDAQVLVLDEPTSSLDHRAEADFLQALTQTPSSRATILVSHRLETIARADRIVVLDGGAIVEEGSHAELVARAGVYARLFDDGCPRATPRSA